MELYETKKEAQNVLLVAVDTGEFDADLSLQELKELTNTAGAIVKSTVKQKRDKPDTATYIGSGMLESIKEFSKNNDINLIIFDSELTHSQIRNIENYTNIRVIDRTMLILDIFASNARSKEGKLQVELAQLKYMLPRLTGKGVQMSRLGGGIGTRGPGETKLETDKRHIRERIKNLKEQLLALETRRKILRSRRIKDGIITVAIVGYTNAGKSTLMNCLTEAGILAEDKLFATLDPTSRALKLPNGLSVMLIDTVGFISRLPHNLVNAFKSTLEEATLADLILNVCDISSPEAKFHLEVTKSILYELGYKDKPIITVFNKCDLVNKFYIKSFDNTTVKISAKNNYGIKSLLNAIEENLPIKLKQTSFLFPFNEIGKISLIRDNYEILKEEYTQNGVSIIASVDNEIIKKLEEFIVK